MYFILYNCSDHIKTITKRYCSEKFIQYYESSNIEEVYKYIEREKNSLIMIEIKESDKQLKYQLNKIKSTNQACQIVGLFNEDTPYQIPEYVNLKLLDGIEILPMEESTFNNLADSFIKAANNKNKIIEYLFDEEYVLKDMLSMEYVYDLIYGHFERIKTLKELTLFLGLSCIPQIVLTLVCDNFWNICENMDNKQRYRLKRIILNTVRKGISKKCKGIAATIIGTDKIVILLDCYPKSGKPAQNSAAEIAQYIKDYVKEKTTYTVTIGISNYCKDYRQLWKAYEESFQALAYSFTHGSDHIIKFDELKKYSNDCLEYPSNLEQNLIRSINKSFEQYYGAYEDVCKYLLFCSCDQVVTKSVLINILFEIMQYSYNIGVDFNILSKIMIETIVKVIKSSSFEDMRETGNRYLNFVVDEIEKLSLDEKNIIITNASAFIQKYYYTDLKLEEVAKVCNLSEYHFSRLFKKYYGKTFIQYLTDLRIQKACQLLSESNLTISETAVKVGYHEAAYFSRLFKNIMGLSPNKYRKNSANSKKVQKQSKIIYDK